MHAYAGVLQFRMQAHAGVLQCGVHAHAGMTQCSVQAYAGMALCSLRDAATRGPSREQGGAQPGGGLPPPPLGPLCVPPPPLPPRPPPWAGHLKCVEVLVKGGAPLGLKCDGCPPLVMAVCTAQMQGREDCAASMTSLLLREGADPLIR